MSSAPTVNQSPINLSQSSSEPCDLLCEFVMDEVLVSQATVSTTNEGVFIYSSAGLGSCKFNGDGYTCNLVLISHPSNHTIESIQADGEVTAVFTNTSNGKKLCVSSLFRQNNNQTPSSKFFNAIVPYANPSSQNTSVNLGNDWSLNMMIPQTGSYFTYNGSYTFEPYSSCRWVVFKSMINIDPNNFALLVKYTKPNFRPIQGTGNRQVFFNEIDRLPGAPTAHDNKLYIRLRKVGKDVKDSVLGKTVTSAPVKAASIENSSSSFMDKISSKFEKTDIFMIIDYILLVVSLVAGVYYGSKLEYRSIGLFVAKRAQPAASFTLRIVYYLIGLMKQVISFFVFFFTRPKQTRAEDV